MTMHIPTGAVNWQEIANNIAVANLHRRPWHGALVFRKEGRAK